MDEEENYKVVMDLLEKYRENEYQQSKLKEIESKLSNIIYVNTDPGYANYQISYDEIMNGSKTQLFRRWVIGETYEMPEGMTFGEIHAELDAIEQSVNKLREKFSYDKFGNK